VSAQNYLAVAGRIRSGLSELQLVTSRTERIWAAGQISGDDWHADAVALNLHGFYAGVERLLEIIAEAVDEAKPAGSDWHQAPLSQMASEIPGVRPPVLSSDTRRHLDRFRGFRHVVRNVYTFNLDRQQIGLLVQLLPTAAADLTTDLTSFADWLKRVAEASGE
jgi:hypothetical protein